MQPSGVITSNGARELAGFGRTAGLPDTESELLDPACIPDIFVEGIGAITKIAGDCVRITLYATRDRGGTIERIVVAQIVWPASLLPCVNAQCRAYIETGLLMLADIPQGIVPS